MAIINKPADYFNTKLYTGTGSAGQAQTGVGFQPDLVWTKSRSNTYPHQLYDVIRGVTKRFQANDSSAETTQANGLTAFGTDGFTVGDASGTGVNGATYASWNWKAGTSGSGTTTGAGTGKAYSYSVNTTSGFSIVKYLGNGTAGHTIPHHLGAVPKMIIVKRDASTNWSTYHVGRGNGNSTPLNEGEAPTTSTTFWNDTTPTSSVFTVGSISNTNNNDSSIIAYCFADIQGYSKISSYIGSGSADGNFLFTGFSPSYVMIKRTTGAYNWMIFDNKRNTSNVIDNRLLANTTGAEVTDSTTHILDFVSNGIKIRSSNSAIGGGSDPYIYMAFAENPFVSNVAGGSVPVTAR